MIMANFNDVHEIFDWTVSDCDWTVIDCDSRQYTQNLKKSQIETNDAIRQNCLIVTS